MTTLHCDHCMSLPYDAVIMLMVITCALITLAIAGIRTYINYYNPVNVSFT